MQGQSQQVKSIQTILEQWDARKKTFLALKDSHGKPIEIGRFPKGKRTHSSLSFLFLVEFAFCCCSFQNNVNNRSARALLPPSLPPTLIARFFLMIISWVVN